MRKGRWVDYVHMMLMVHLYPQECWAVALLCLISGFDFCAQDHRMPKQIIIFSDGRFWYCKARLLKSPHLICLQIIQVMFICITVNGMLHWNGEDGEEQGQDTSEVKDSIDSDSLTCMSHCYLCECTADTKPTPNLININPEFLFTFFSLCKILCMYT